MAILENLSEEKRNYILSGLAYAQLFNNPDEALKYKNKCTLGQLASYFENADIKVEGGLDIENIREMFNEIKNDVKLSNLLFTDYANNNASGDMDGFVGYSFKDSEENSYFAFRGSETDTPEGQHEGFLGIDWLDDYRLVIEGKSYQFADVKSFVTANSLESEKIYVTGHSKGGANALYVCSQFNNATGIAFDSPGIDQAISNEEKVKLKASGVTNYVASEDKVGALLFHSENRMFCKMNQKYYVTLDDKQVKVDNYNKAEGQDVFTDLFIPHALQAFFWDSNNELIEAERSILSKRTEQLSQDIYMWNNEHGKPLNKILDWIIENRDYLDGVVEEKIKQIIVEQLLNYEYKDKLIEDNVISFVNNVKKAIVKEIEVPISKEEKNTETIIKFIEDNAKILEEDIKKEARNLKDKIEEEVV